MLYYFFCPWYFINEDFKKGKKMTKVSKDMGIMEIVTAHPETLEVFAQYGMGCIGCAAAHFENLEAGAKVHGIDVDEMVNAMNEIIEKKSGQ
jgi:hybrid cluster-associated redox disulfide protein